MQKTRRKAMKRYYEEWGHVKSGPKKRALKQGKPIDGTLSYEQRIQKEDEFWRKRNLLN